MQLGRREKVTRSAFDQWDRSTQFRSCSLIGSFIVQAWRAVQVQRGRRALKYHDDLVCNAVHSAWLAANIFACSQGKRERERGADWQVADESCCHLPQSCHRFSRQTCQQSNNNDDSWRSWPGIQLPIITRCKSLSLFNPLFFVRVRLKMASDARGVFKYRYWQITLTSPILLMHVIIQNWWKIYN